MRVAGQARLTGRSAVLAAVFLFGVSAPPAIEAGKGYESLPLKKREWQLIENARILEAQAATREQLYKHPELNALISKVGSQLAPPPTDTYLEYRFHILRNPHPGAFALSDGQVYVNVGMLAILENEAQLATLLAHEINHAAGHHGIRRYRSSRRKGMVGLVGAVVVVSALVALGEDPMDLFEGTTITRTETEVAIPEPAIVGYRWRHEKDADRRAIRRVAEVGYDVRESSRLFEILGRDLAGERTDDRTKWGNRAQLPKRAALMRRIASDIGNEIDLNTLEIGAERYRDLRWRASLDTAHEFIRTGYASSAVAVAETLVEQRHDDPEAHFALAEGYLVLGDQQDNALPKALLEYTRTLSLDSEFAEAHRGLGFALFRIGSLEEAARELEVYLQARPQTLDRPLVLHRLERIKAELDRDRIDDATVEVSPTLNKGGENP